MRIRRLMFGLVPLALAASGMGPASAPGASAEPAPMNILLILTDDQTMDSLAPGDPVVMPKLEARLADPGDHWIRFTNAYLNTPLCCPSRASILTGQYEHHHGVVNNDTAFNFDDSSTVATWLDAAGYRTGLFGKYLNDYPWDGDPFTPPGWDDWAAYVGPGRYWNYWTAEGGQLIEHGNAEADYATRYFAQRANEFMTSGSDPFFAVFSPNASHDPWQYERKYANEFEGTPPLRPPNFNEPDVSDKPKWLQSVRVIDSSRVARLDANRLDAYRTLLSVDDAVESMLDSLETSGKLDNTVIVYMTDNGYVFGEHRLGGKRCVYEECQRTPFFVRSPGAVPHDDPRLVTNVDLAPTFTDVAGTTPGLPADGVSLLPVIQGGDPAWRSDLLLEYVRDMGDAPMRPSFYALRTEAGLKYVENGTGDKELYDLNTDPYELQNVHGSPTYAVEEQSLADRLRALVGTDLEIAMEVSPTQVREGRRVTYTITVTNAGPERAEDVRMRDRLPNRFRRVSVNGDWVCSEGDDVRCSIGRIDPSESVVGTVRAVAQRTGAVTNTATVGSVAPELESPNNVAAATVSVKHAERR